MRTTLNIDDEVLQTVREIARQRNLPTGTVVSALLRQALTGKTPTTRKDRDRPGSVAGFRPFPERDTPVDNDLIDRLRDEVVPGTSPGY